MADQTVADLRGGAQAFIAPPMVVPTVPESPLVASPVQRGPRLLSGNTRKSLRLGPLVKYTAIALSVAALWEAIKFGTGEPSILMPDVWSLLAYLGQRTSSGQLYLVYLAESDLYTLTDTVSGLLCGAVVGLVSGILIAKRRLFRLSVLPLSVVAQTVPIVALAPALVVWLGTGAAVKSVIAGYLTFFPVTIATAKGIGGVHEDSRAILTTHLATSWQVLSRLELPAASPLIFLGLETSAALSVIGAIVAELPFGSEHGIGSAILLGWQYYNFDPRSLYCASLAACALGGAMVIAIRLVRLGFDRYLKLGWSFRV